MVVIGSIFDIASFFRPRFSGQDSFSRGLGDGGGYLSGEDERGGRGGGGVDPERDGDGLGGGVGLGGGGRAVTI